VKDIAIRVENLGKLYRIGQGRTRYETLRDRIALFARSPLRHLKYFGTRLQKRESDFIWAIKDVSFEVRRGEVVGIIGRNGAGKSTLLKILCRITEPTEGYAEIHGRVGSLLEVGTGFHPELTGRENIYLNGAILGMRKAEIDRKFDEIVAFAEIENFLDTPVKRYSSGMYVRLAFAVAAHLEPEILLVDEVLAVGDAGFQKKCLGKMSRVSQEGRTVLFVSHNMTAIRNLCHHVIWMKDGKKFGSGMPSDVIEEYLKESVRNELFPTISTTISSLPEDPFFRFNSIIIRQDKVSTNVLLNGKSWEIEIRYSVYQKMIGLRIYFDLCDEEEEILIRTFHDDDADEPSVIEPGDYVSTALVPRDLLAPRSYILRIRATIYNVRSIPPEGIKIPIHVESTNGINRAYPNEPIRSKLQPRIFWSTDLI